MNSPISSRVRLLTQYPPLDALQNHLIQSVEDEVSPLLVKFGDVIATERTPLNAVYLVVEGGLRVIGRDTNGKDFTIRRVSPGQWFGTWSAIIGTSVASCRATSDTKVLAVPLHIWRHWFHSSLEMREWISSHPQREDIYSAFRDFLVQRELQDPFISELLDRVQSQFRSLFISDGEDADIFQKKM